jgi:hypothetical protein
MPSTSPFASKRPWQTRAENPAYSTSAPYRVRPTIGSGFPRAYAVHDLQI